MYSFFRFYKNWLIWLCAALFYLYEFLHRIIPSVIIPELSDHFQVSSTRLGNLSACYYYIYGIMQIPIGLLLDQYGSQRLLPISCLCVSIGGLIFSNTSQIIIAEFARILIGLGSAAAFMSCLKLGSQLFSNHWLPFITGLTNMTGVLGATLGGPVYALSLALWTWQTSLFWIGLFGLLLTVLLLIVLPKPTPAAQTPQSIPAWKLLKIELFSLIKNKNIFKISLFAMLTVVSISAYSELWGTQFLTAKYPISTHQAALISSSTFLGSAIGGAMWGFLAYQLLSVRQILNSGLLLSFISLTYILYAPVVPIGTLILLHILFGVGVSSMLLCYAVNSEFVKPKHQGTVIGWTNAIVTIGSIFAQPGVGFIYDQAQNVSFISDQKLYSLQLGLLTIPICQLFAFFLINYKSQKLFHTKYHSLN